VERVQERFQLFCIKLNLIRKNQVEANKLGNYFHVSREQALGICFMRWYTIAANLYDLEMSEAEGLLPSK